jgi:hypothetical protein
LGSCACAFAGDGGWRQPYSHSLALRASTVEENPSKPEPSTGNTHAAPRRAPPNSSGGGDQRDKQTARQSGGGGGDGWHAHVHVGRWPKHWVGSGGGDERRGAKRGGTEGVAEGVFIFMSVVHIIGWHSTGGNHRVGRWRITVAPHVSFASLVSSHGDGPVQIPEAHRSSTHARATRPTQEQQQRQREDRNRKDRRKRWKRQRRRRHKRRRRHQNSEPTGKRGVARGGPIDAGWTMVLMGGGGRDGGEEMEGQRRCDGPSKIRTNSEKGVVRGTR